MNNTTEKYVAGVDGGGTKTLLEVHPLNGGTPTRAKFGQVNLNGSTPDAVSSVIKQIFAQLAEMPGGLSACAALCIGSAGVSNPAQMQLLENAVKETGYTAPLYICGDNETSLACALGGGAGLMLSSGTGSFCMGKNLQGETAMVGGWGYLIGDEGSGYAIGRDIAAAAVKAMDGSGPETLLLPALMQKLGVKNRQELIKAIYVQGEEKKNIAALSPLLEPAAEQKDAAAVAIVEKCAKELCALAVGAANKLGMQNGTIALAGSVLQNSQPINSAVTALLQKELPAMQIKAAVADAAAGAVILAKQLL